jgi:hypothetical protein
MAFIKEFLSDFIKRTLMEDPLERREWRNKHIADVSAKAAALCVPRAACGGEARACALALGLRHPQPALLRPVARRARAQVRSAGFDAAPCARAPQQGVLGVAVEGARLLAGGRQQRGGAPARRAAPRRLAAPCRAAPRKPYRSTALASG